MFKNQNSHLIVTLCAFATVLSLLAWKSHVFWPKHNSLQYMVHEADVVDITQYGQAQDGTLISDHGLAVLNNSKNASLLHLLKESSGFHSIPPIGPADYTVCLRSYKDRRHTESYWYFIATGELGRDHTWCYVPKTFQAWVKTLPKPHHGKYRITKTWWYEAGQEVN